jgi:cell division protein ZapA
VTVKKTTRVEIYDQSYSISGDGDETYVQELAAEVDGRMREIAREAKMVDSLRVAVLTAMNLADENRALRERCGRLEETVTQRASSLNEMLDRALSRVS